MPYANPLVHFMAFNQPNNLGRLWISQCVPRSLLQRWDTHSSSSWEYCWLTTTSQVHPLELYPPGGRELPDSRSHVSSLGAAYNQCLAQPSCLHMEQLCRVMPAAGRWWYWDWLRSLSQQFNSSLCLILLPLSPSKDWALELSPVNLHANLQP